MKIVSLLLISTSVLAAGDGSITDLAMPAVNFLIFCGILFAALRKPITTHFASHADNVAATYERAQIKKKEADARITEAESKMQNSDVEAKRIKEAAEADIKKFGEDYAKEIEERIEKYKQDSRARIKAEESTMLNNLNAKLVNSVVSKAKSKIGSDVSLKEKATKKLVKDVR